MLGFRVLPHRVHDGGGGVHGARRDVGLQAGTHDPGVQLDEGRAAASPGQRLWERVPNETVRRQSVRRKAPSRGAEETAQGCSSVHVGTPQPRVSACTKGIKAVRCQEQGRQQLGRK